MNAPRSEGGRRARGERKRGTSERPLVSVITVVRNAAVDIARTIEGVLSQSYETLEYIVVDGQSDDGTLDVIRRYDDRIDYWVSERDTGIYDAMNKGVELVSDQNAFIIFANASDKLYSPEALARAVARAGDADLVYGKMRLTDGDESGVMGREVTVSDLATETLCHPATMMRRRVFDKVGVFDTRYKIAADYDLIVRCFQYPVKSRFVDEIISEMQMGGISEDRFMLSCSERKKVVRERFGYPERLAGVWQVNLYDIPRNAARRWLSQAGLLGQWRELRRSLASRRS